MTKTFAKTLIIFAILILGALAVTGVVQSFVLSSLEAKLIASKAQEKDIEDKLKSVEEELAYKESLDYYRDYNEQENGYGKENDKIYEVN